MPQGKPLLSEEKKMIVKVKHYFDEYHIKSQSDESSIKRTADAVGVGVSTVKRIMSDLNKDPKLLDKEFQPRGRPTYSIDASYQEIVRGHVRQANK